MRWVRGGLGVLGLAALAYGAVGVLSHVDGDLVGYLAFLGGVLVAHDLVLLPLAIGVGWLLVRFVPGWARPFIQSGLYASVVVAFVAFPFVLGRGRIADNPSRQPLEYGRGLLVVLAVIWLVVLAALAVRYRGVRRRPREEAS